MVARLTIPRASLAATVLAAAAALMAAAPAAGKQGANKPARASAESVLIANRVAGGPPATTDVPLSIGKKFKGRSAGIVTITTQATGNGPSYLDDLNMLLISPQGRTVFLEAPPFFFDPGPANQSYGPLTETPDSPLFPCEASIPRCTNPDGLLPPPYVGTIGNDALADFYGARIRGTWTLRIRDFSLDLGGLLNLARLEVKPAKPIE
jgi:hypothetical protein